MSGEQAVVRKGIKIATTGPKIETEHPSTTMVLCWGSQDADGSSCSPLVLLTRGRPASATPWPEGRRKGELSPRNVGRECGAHNQQL